MLPLLHKRQTQLFRMRLCTTFQPVWISRQVLRCHSTVPLTWYPAYGYHQGDPWQLWRLLLALHLVNECTVFVGGTHTHTHIYTYIYIYTHTHTTCGVVIYQVLNPSIHFVSFVYADTEVEEWWKTNRKGLGAWLASNYSVLSASSIAVSLATHLWSVCQIMTTVFLFSCFYYEEFWFTGKIV